MPFTLTPGEGFGLDVEDTEYLKDHFQAPDRWVLNFGPQHPATHTTLRLVLELDGEHTLNPGRRTLSLVVQNGGDRPIQVGSHYHFAETNGALVFDRAAAQGMRLNIAAGTAVRFEPGQQRTVELVDYSGKREVYGFRALTNGLLPAAPANAKGN